MQHNEEQGLTRSLKRGMHHNNAMPWQGSELARFLHWKLPHTQHYLSNTVRPFNPTDSSLFQGGNKHACMHTHTHTVVHFRQDLWLKSKCVMLKQCWLLWNGFYFLICDLMRKSITHPHCQRFPQLNRVYPETR